MRILYRIYSLVISLCFLVSCGERDDSGVRGEVDSLNLLSCRLLYVSSEQSESKAKMAMAKSGEYENGKMEALVNLGNVYTMRMEYDTARRYYNEVLSSSDNCLYRFLTYARLMKICQVTASNLEFYEYHTAAEKCANRILEDESVMNSHETTVWKVANCLYNMCLSSHFYTLRYDEEMEKAHNDYLTWYHSLGADSVILTPMFQKKTLSFWKHYGNLYYESMCLVNIADSLMDDSRCDEALDSLKRALDCVNEYYGLTGDDRLTSFTPGMNNVMSKEMTMICDSSVLTIPEWIGAIREELSIVYGALGQKEASDYNHNIYFDILDATRQDMSLQERQERLQRENRVLDYMLCGLGLFVLFSLLFVLLATRRLTSDSRRKAERLSMFLSLCSKITKSVPVDADSEECVSESIHEAVDKDVYALFPEVKDDWTTYDTNKMDGLDRELLSVLKVLYNWVLRNASVFVKMSEEKERVEGLEFVYSRRLEEHKRQYIDKATSMSIVNGVTPFLDRMIHEVDRLSEMSRDDFADKGEDALVYVRELINKIDEYNEVLGHWVKIRQGKVSLNVESFRVQPLFDTLVKGRAMFETKKITLDVVPSDAVVKADPVLTLFMLNTLMDNARKYTPEGGRIVVLADEREDFVELSVSDTGCGLSEEDVDVLNNNKVYDSSKIGAGDASVVNNKGFGFGLMNCRGIIEKYKKTSTLFSVCLFGVESEVSKGSRFYFRLPKGVVRTLAVLIAFLVTSVATASEARQTDSINVSELKMAVQFYDSVFSCNMRKEYAQAVVYADSSIYHFNRHYLLSAPDGKLLMSVDGSQMPELTLFKSGFETDYSTILDIRNEIAIAALALNDRHLYTYNNEIFTRLYKLMSDDKSLEYYCDSMQKSTVNKRVVFILAALTFLVLMFVYAMIYYRHNLLYIFNMRQFLRFSQHLFSSSEEDQIGCLYKGVNEIRKAEAIGLAMVDVEDDGKLVFEYKGDEEYRSLVNQYSLLCYEKKQRMGFMREKILSLPLVVDMNGEEKCIGAVTLMLRDASLSKNDDLCLQLIAEFFAVHSYMRSTRVNESRMELEMRVDEMRRKESEDNRIHVQNMVLDNYLSTIKHETMYYPGRIRKIVDDVQAEATAEKMAMLSEVVSYYKDVYSLLRDGASLQLERKVFKRERISLSLLCEHMRAYFKKRAAKDKIPVSLSVSDVSDGLTLTADKTLVMYMIETLANISFENAETGEVSMRVDDEGRFVRITYIDSRLSYSEERCNSLFYPDSIRYDESNDKLCGQYFILLRQIVREHDEYMGHKGCRIYASPVESGGAMIVMEL